MKKIIAGIILSAMITCMLPVSFALAEGNIYYVSPNGEDTNPGTREEPFKTLYTAAQILEAGDTAIFMDGTYHETQYTEFNNGGTKEAPVTIKSENKHGAVISYSEDLVNFKINITKSYITVQDFVITQKGNHTSNKDILLNCGLGKGREIEGLVISGNRFYNVYEEGIKVKYVKNALIKDNIVENSKREGLDIFGCDGAVISGNTVINCGRVGYMIKGNSRNCVVYNNTMQSTNEECTHGFQIGGSSDGSSPYLTENNIAFEAYNCVFFNNIAFASSPALMGKAFSFSGAKDCHAYNNIAYGAKNAFSFSKATNEAWQWQPPTVSPTLYNNISMNVTKAYDFVDGVPEGMISDYNIFFNVSNSSSVPQSEENSLLADPYFTDADKMDFTLKHGSPARRMGIELPSEVDAYDGIEEYINSNGETVSFEASDPERTVSIPHIDFNNLNRKTPWSMGAYDDGKDISAELLYEDFENATEESDISGYNGWTERNDTDTNYSTKAVNLNGNNVARAHSYATKNSTNSFIYKKLPIGVYNNAVVIEFSVCRNNENAKAFTLEAFRAKDNTRVTDFNFNFSTGKALGKSIPALKSMNKWETFELVLDVNDETGYSWIYYDGELKVSKYTLSSGAKFESIGAITVGAKTLSEEGEFYFDNVSVLKLGELTVTKVIPSKDGNLKKAEVFFSHNIAPSDVLPSNITISEPGVYVDEITPINGSKRHFMLTFNEALEPETTYSLEFNNISDFYSDVTGKTQTINNLGVDFTTRDAITNIGEIKFYSEFDDSCEPVLKTEVASLEGFSNDNVTVAVDITNERKNPFKSVLIAVHKRENKIISVSADDTDISSGSGVKKLSFTGVNEGDLLEAYLWNSIKGMVPLADGNSIGFSESPDISLNGEIVIDSVSDVKASLSETLNADDMQMLVSAKAEKKNAAVTAYVLKPDKSFDNLTASNFSSYVDYVGQQVLNEDMECGFSYIISGGQNNKKYIAYVGGNNVSRPAKDEVTYFSASFVDAVVQKIAGATAEEIKNMLSGHLFTVSGVQIDVNDLLKLDLTKYNSLKDYSEKENFKTRVLEKMAEATFGTKSDVISAFEKNVDEQIKNEENYKTLLKKINDDVWGELEKTLTENHATVLYDAYNGSYNSIKENSTLREAFYKKLANGYTFKNFKELREAFENEAKALIPKTPVTPGFSGGGGGGGSGGGGGGKYSNSLISPEEVKPLDKKESENEKESEKISFSDISDVPWANEAILSLSSANIINGTGDGKFAPHSNVTREQFVKMVILAFDLYDENASSVGFIDVVSGQWYEKYIASAVEKEIIYGVDYNHFGIGKEISRAEMAVICYRAATKAGKKLAEGKKTCYGDSADIPEYAMAAIEAMSSAGIINGVGNNLFAPNEKATRAMAAKVVYLLRGEM